MKLENKRVSQVTCPCGNVSTTQGNWAFAAAPSGWVAWGGVIVCTSCVAAIDELLEKRAKAGADG